MEGLKYEMLKEYPEDKHYRIRALKDIIDDNGVVIVKKGEYGGIVFNDAMLSQVGSCWIGHDASVRKSHIDDSAIVSGSACVNHSIVRGHSHITDKAKINDSDVRGFSVIKNTATVVNKSIIYDSYICDDAYVDNSYVYNGKVCEEQNVYGTVVGNDLSRHLTESIRCQTGLIPMNGKVIAYKQVKKNLRSFYDDNFEYEIGKVIIAEYPNVKTNNACSGGLHFSNANYWNGEHAPMDSVFLVAEIDLNDIITVQRGKIRCTKAKILGGYDPTGANGVYLKETK